PPPPAHHESGPPVVHDPAHTVTETHLDRPHGDVSLGTQLIEGLTATGRRTVLTIPVGQIGNDRPIEITDERWESTELRVLVLSRHHDPRTGEVQYRLTTSIAVSRRASCSPSRRITRSRTRRPRPRLRRRRGARNSAKAAKTAKKKGRD